MTCHHALDDPVGLSSCVQALRRVLMTASASSVTEQARGSTAERLSRGGRRVHASRAGPVASAPLRCVVQATWEQAFASGTIAREAFTAERWICAEVGPP